jgi:phage tail-like protein
MAEEIKAEPFITFNFSVEVTKAEITPESTAQPLCSAAFAECDGIEMTMEVKTLKEGGANGQLVRLTGPVSYGQLTLKRGMTENFELWNWFRAVVADPSLRANVEVVMLAPDGIQPRAHFLLRRCVPVKVKAPPLNAKDGVLAIEELQLAYESISFKAAKPKREAQNA